MNINNLLIPFSQIFSPDNTNKELLYWFYSHIRDISYYLVQCCFTMSENNLVHNNISLNSIYFKSYKDLHDIKDFNEVIVIKDFQNHFNLNNVKSIKSNIDIYNPPEVILLFLFLNNKNINKDFNNWINNTKKFLDISNINDYTKLLYPTITTTKNLFNQFITEQKSLNDTIKLIYFKNDIYAMGLVIYSMIKFLSEEFGSNLKIGNLFKYVEYITNPDFVKRLSAKEALDVISHVKNNL